MRYSAVRLFESGCLGLSADSGQVQAYGRLKAGACIQGCLGLNLTGFPLNPNTTPIQNQLSRAPTARVGPSNYAPMLVLPRRYATYGLACLYAVSGIQPFRVHSAHSGLPGSVLFRASRALLNACPPIPTELRTPTAGPQMPEIPRTRNAEDRTQRRLAGLGLQASVTELELDGMRASRRC
jgi:hypothetical protein